MAKDDATKKARIIELLNTAKIAFQTIELKGPWITVNVGPKAENGITARICEALNPEFGFMVATSFR